MAELKNTMSATQLSDFAAIPKTTKSENYKTAYVNSSRMGVSPWDVRITFGQVKEGQDGVAVNEDEMTVIMAPAQAKAIAENLVKTIGEFEKLFGEIKNPMAMISAAKQKMDAQFPSPKTKSKK